MAEKYVYAKMNKAGLCNMLFPWARAVVYAKATGARMIAPKWTDIMRIGPWIRREKYKRYYFNEFSNEGYVSRLYGLRTNPIALRLLGVKVFSGMRQMFGPFLQDWDFVKNELRRITNPVLVANADLIGKRPFIGVHIRRGDFCLTNKELSDEWYVSAIEMAYEKVGVMPVKIFSDAEANALSNIADKVRNAEIMPTAPAMQDLLTLSHARAIVCTADSTFSMWPVFLGQMPSIWSKKATMTRLYVDETTPILV